MKSYKLLLSVLALAAVAASPVLRAEDATTTPPAAGAPEHKGPKGDRLKMLTEKLGLSDAQVAQIKPILMDEAKAMKALHEDTTTDKQAKHEQMMEIHKTHVDQILAILTPDQQAKFKALMEQRRKGPPAAPKPTS